MKVTMERLQFGDIQNVKTHLREYILWDTKAVIFKRLRIREGDLFEVSDRKLDGGLRLTRAPHYEYWITGGRPKEVYICEEGLKKHLPKVGNTFYIRRIKKGTR